MDQSLSLEACLERNEVVHLPACPFALPAEEDLEFLRGQTLRTRRDKNISYNPATGRVAGFRRHGQAQAERLRHVMEEFAASAERWLKQAAPRYAAGWHKDRVSFRPEEEATRQLRHTARNDLLHVDNFPSRPSGGARLLRVFANINPSQPRVWMTSDPFPRLLERYGAAVGLPAREQGGWPQRLTQNVLGLFRRQRSPYDAFMLRMHHFLKNNEQFQEKGPRRYWSFGPGSAWVVFTDSVSHAVLRGRYALEYTFFVPVNCMLDPSQAPVALLQRAAGVPVLRRAA